MPANCISGASFTIDQKASTIANTVTDTVLDLRMRRLIMCSIATNNASNGCAGLNTEVATSVQGVTAINVCRTPCLSHTGNLAVWDILMGLGAKQAIPCDV
jgi:hypothetical protein